MDGADILFKDKEHTQLHYYKKSRMKRLYLYTVSIGVRGVGTFNYFTSLVPIQNFLNTLFSAQTIGSTFWVSQSLLDTIMQM